MSLQIYQQYTNILHITGKEITHIRKLETEKVQKQFQNKVERHSKEVDKNSYESDTEKNWNHVNKLKNVAKEV